MATSTYLSNPVITVNSVDMSDQCSSAVFTRVIESLQSTAFGQTNRSYVGGLENSTLVCTFFNSFSASETYATLKSLVGTQTTVTLKPTSGSNSVTNPLSTLTASFLETLPITNAQLGALDVITVTFTGGAYSVTIV